MWFTGWPSLTTLTLTRSVSNMSIYRKIYEENYGTIPIDDDGRTYEIHHIDGNRKNNDPANLKAVSIQEHYDIHYKQGDWAACLRISNRMSLSQKELSDLAKLNAKKRIENKTHPFLGSELQNKRLKEGSHNFIGLQTKLVEEGIHHFLNGDNQRKWVNERILNKTHHWLTEDHKKKTSERSKDLINQGNHNFQKKIYCECGCNKMYNLGNYKQHQKKLTNV